MTYKNYDINVQFVSMPPRIRALVSSNEDDSYTILINKDLTPELQKEAFLHEMQHIESGDLSTAFLGDKTVDYVEAKAHNLLEGNCWETQ